MKKLLFFLLLLPRLVKAQTNPQTVWLTGVPPLTVSPTGASFSPTFRKVFGTDSLSMQLFAGITSTNFYQVYTATQSNARFILNQNTFDQPANLRINGGASFRAFSTQRGAITGNGFNFSSSGFGQSLSINANVSGTANGDTLSSLHLSGAFVSNTGLATATITNGGGSYTNGTYTNIGVIDASSTHQGATIALATVVISGGAITSFTFPGPQYGAGYSVSDVITINASDVGGTGTGFAATVATLHTYSGVVPFDLISDSGVLFKKGVQATGLSSGTVVSGGWIGEDSGGNFVLGTPTTSVAWGAITGTLSSQSDLNTALGLKANINSQAFTGTPSLPTGATGITQTSGNNTTRLATTAFVSSAISALGPFLNLGGSNQTVTQTPDFTTGLTAEGDIIITGSGGTGVAITDGISKNSLITDENASFNDGTASVIYRTYQIAFTGASGFGQTFNPATTLTAGRTITLPDASGTVALVGGAGVGTVTNVSAGLGMNFTTITTSGAVSLDTTFAKTKASALADYNNLVTSIATKQATLISGTNIKTVNSTTLLGSGNLAITTANTDTTATGFAPKAALIPYLTKASIVSTYVPKTTTIAGFALSGNITLANHTPGYGLVGSAYNGSTVQALTADTANTTALVSKGRLATNLGGYQKTITASNGVTLTSGALKLGGTLTAITSININAHELNLGTGNNSISVLDDSNSIFGTAGNGTTNTAFNLSPTLLDFSNNVGEDFAVKTTGVVFTSAVALTGPKLGGQYNANLTSLSLMPKSATDSLYALKTTGLTAIGITTANGVSGTSSGGTTPNLTISLGAITPTSIGSATTATTQSAGDNSTKIATTAYVNSYAPLSGNLSQFASTTSAQLRAVLSDESGTGAAIFAGGALGAATATSINGITITSSTGTLTVGTGTLALANGISLTVQGKGDAVLVAGTKAVSITGVTTSSRAIVTRTVAAGTSLTTGFTAVCSSGTLTITADLAAGTINTADTSTYTYIVIL